MAQRHNLAMRDQVTVARRRSRESELLRLQAASMAVVLVVLLLIVLSSCVGHVEGRFGENVVAVPADGFGRPDGRSFQIPTDNLDVQNPQDAASDGTVHLNPDFTYWLAAGDAVSVSWDKYLLQICDREPAFNLCDRSYFDSYSFDQPDGPASCVRVQFYCATTLLHGNCPRAWLFECPKHQCDMKRAFQTNPPSWPKSYAVGCSPRAASFTPLDDATFELWASGRLTANEATTEHISVSAIDDPNNPPDENFGDRRSGSPISVNVVKPGDRKVLTKRRPLKLACGPPAVYPSAHVCSPTSDPAESRWQIDPDFHSDEYFSSRLRVKEVHLFASDDGMAPQVPFCWIQIGEVHGSRAYSDCDDAQAMSNPMYACKATLGTNVTPASPEWTVAFTDAPQVQPDGSTLPSRCPNKRTYARHWLEFTLEVRH